MPSFPLYCAAAALFSALTATAGAAVEFQRLPAGGVQPQVVVTEDHAVHQLWLGGDPKAADVFYKRVPEGRPDTHGPVRVNSQPGSAVALGTIRGAQLAVGRAGRVHVVWNGSGAAAPRPRGSAPLLYSRRDASGLAFEPQRNLITRSTDLDGGGTVSADAEGHVFVLWHGGTPDQPTSEDKRRVYQARSDDGKTFAPETPVTDGTGACGCCGMKSFADASGNVFALYRAAGAHVHRTATLAVSRDHGATFTLTPLQDWETGSCPMSSAAFLGSPNGVWAAWETKGRVYFSEVGGKAPAPVPVASAPGAKHPALATNSRGETLVVWTEGTGWQHGGDLAWQVCDRAGQPTAEHGRKPGIPVWSFAAAFARPDGQFVIVY